MSIGERLRPGRQRLSRDEVKAHQRERIFSALETVMSTQGYSDTSVADLIASAGVSRQTFYQLFSSKEDCFLASYARRQESVIGAILESKSTEPPMQRFAALLSIYLTVMAADPALARLYLIGVYAAGPQVIAKRTELQQQFVEGVATLLEARTDQEHFACRMLVAAISTLVTQALLEENPQGVLDLHEPLLKVAAQLLTVEPKSSDGHS